MPILYSAVFKGTVNVADFSTIPGAANVKPWLRYRHSPLGRLIVLYHSVQSVKWLGCIHHRMAAWRLTTAATLVAWAGNFSAVAKEYLEKASRNDGKFTYVVEGTTFNFFTKEGTSESGAVWEALGTLVTLSQVPCLDHAMRRPASSPKSCKHSLFMTLQCMLALLQPSCVWLMRRTGG